MAFKIFRPGIEEAPYLYGDTGSLLSVLDYCLITGSGWLKPIPNTGSFPAQPDTMTYACYQQPTGSGKVLFLNDGQPHSTALAREAWATGWEVILDLSASVKNSVGYGIAPFPTSSQLTSGMSAPYGHVVIRKSATADKVNDRPYVLAADSSSFYLLIKTGDKNSYFGFAFGDCYSFVSGTIDPYKCFIMGRSAENSNATTNESFDILSTIFTGIPGIYIDRNYTGVSLSVTASKHGDGIKGGATQFNGNIPYPHGPDNSLYVSPIWLIESGAPNSVRVRGMLRGIYQACHVSTSFVDGQEFSGSGDYEGKSFLVVMPTPNNGAIFIETSDTLLTN